MPLFLATMQWLFSSMCVDFLVKFKFETLHSRSALWNWKSAHKWKRENLRFAAEKANITLLKQFVVHFFIRCRCVTPEFIIGTSFYLLEISSPDYSYHFLNNHCYFVYHLKPHTKSCKKELTSISYHDLERFCGNLNIWQMIIFS